MPENDNYGWKHEKYLKINSIGMQYSLKMQIIYATSIARPFCRQLN